jgi:hypothetical protein
MPLPLVSTYNDIGNGKECFYIFYFFVFFKNNKKNANIFVWYQVLTIYLSHRCKFVTTRRIPTTSVEEQGR